MGAISSDAMIELELRGGTVTLDRNRAMNLGVRLHAMHNLRTAAQGKRAV